MQPRVWKPLSDGDTLSFGGTIQVQRQSQTVRNPFVYVVGIDATTAEVMRSLGSGSPMTSCDRDDENSSSGVNAFGQVLVPINASHASEAVRSAGVVPCVAFNTIPCYVALCNCDLLAGSYAVRVRCWRPRWCRCRARAGG
jgi:hypothetical protein